MIARALGVSFRRALRSVALTLFPLAFIALFAWASAGSTTGSTSDPVRASAWLYLGAHLVPFAVPSGKLTFLPLLAVLYPMWAIRRGLPMVEGAFNKLNGARIIYALWYSILSELLALASRYHGVGANLYLTPFFTFIIAMVATARFNQSLNRAFYFGLYLLSIALGVGTLAFTFSLFQHLSEIKSISVVLGSGIVGGVLTTLLQLLYLPNFALAALAYITGIGFNFGATSFSHGSLTGLGQIPALPFLTALPTTSHPELKYAVVAWFVLFALLMIFILREGIAILARTQILISQGARIFIVIAAIAYLSAGELLSSNLNPVGVRWLHLLAYLAAAFGASTLLALYLPIGITRWVRRE